MLKVKVESTHILGKKVNLKNLTQAQLRKVKIYCPEIFEKEKDGKGKRK